MPNPHIWDSTKNEMEIVTLGPNTKVNYNFDFRLFISFSDIEAVAGQPVSAVFDALTRKVESVFMAIEAESRRLGYIK